MWIGGFRLIRHSSNAPSSLLQCPWPSACSPRAQRTSSVRCSVRLFYLSLFARPRNEQLLYHVVRYHLEAAVLPGVHDMDKKRLLFTGCRERNTLLHLGAVDQWLTVQYWPRGTADPIIGLRVILPDSDNSDWPWILEPRGGRAYPSTSEESPYVTRGKGDFYHRYHLTCKHMPISAPFRLSSEVICSSFRAFRANSLAQPPKSHWRVTEASKFH